MNFKSKIKITQTTIKKTIINFHFMTVLYQIKAK